MIPLLHRNAEGKNLLPQDAAVLLDGDCILFCGRESAMHAQQWALQNINALEYLVVGDVSQYNPVVRWVNSKLNRR